MEVFEATPYDLPALANLFDAYRQFYGKKPGIEPCRDFLAERLQKRDSVIYIIRNDDGETIAFVQLYPLFSSVHLKKLWMLNDLYVEQRYRKKGAAAMLLERCRQLAVETGARGLLLETAKNNKEANELYAAAGYNAVDGANFYFLDVSS